LKGVGEIKDPVHGYIRFTEVEKKLIDSTPVQRLRNIKQLAGAELTYPGAVHTRFLHSLGVMHLAGMLGVYLAEKGYISEEEIQKVRLAGLLHDVGHGPFSHVYEEILEKHRHQTHEDLTQWVIESSEIGDILSSHGFSKKEIAQLSTGHLDRTERIFLNQVIAGHFSADIMDYLARDSYFAGVEYGKVDAQRLISSLELIEKRLMADGSGAFGVLESFIIARMEMFNTVYFHRTVRATNVMIARAMDFACEKLGLASFKDVEEFLRLDDGKVLEGLLSLKKEVDQKLQKAYQYILGVRSRKLLKSTYELIIFRKDTFFSNLLNKPNIRREVEVEIGEKTGVDPDFIVIDVPQVLSVPINPVERQRSDILVYRKTPAGVIVQKATELSPLLASLTQFMDIVRVYTLPQFREKVAEVCEKTFGGKPFSAKISV
jgi:hypothetical protein